MAPPPVGEQQPGGGQAAAANARAESGAEASVSVSRYEKLGRIGEGTYGVVYRARDRRAAPPR